ncbi:MAG: pro-sigmaK processing inhibitor BofA family protein [Clostridia bacterium]|nr:pro-sigmaK processing inhibitor BofA family protein [Clostridia bacterium]
MHIPTELIISFAIGLALISLLGYLLLVPRRFLWRLAAGSVLGGVTLFIINVFSNITGVAAAINPFTALLTGLLGLPGTLLILLLTHLFT